jgi:hypothetical protein
VKTDRLSATRAAVVMLAGLLLAAGPPTAGQTFTFHLGRSKARVVQVSSSKALAGALAQQVGEVRARFDENRRALRAVKGPGGKPAYLRPDVVGLIARTSEDLDQAIEKVQPSGTEPLRAWTVEELGRIQGELAAAPAQKTAALPSGLFAPRAVAVIASLRGFPLLGLAKGKVKAAAPQQDKAAAPQQDTVPAEKTDSLLDRAGEVVGRIFLLASHDDLEVKLWVGSAPAPHATFSFWSQGQLKGAAPASLIIRTDGKRDHVLRGLYAYKATDREGPVTKLVQYPSPAGAPATQLVSERLDLVNGSSFFCCRFNEQYCHHVASEKECRP